MFFAKKIKCPSPSHFEAGTNWGNAFRTQVIRAAEVSSIVISAEYVRASGKLKGPRTEHWLSPFLTFPNT